MLNKILTRQTTEIIDTIDTATGEANTVVNNYIRPVRESILKRFPVLFSLLGAFGLTATFLGIENSILKYELFIKYPELILLIGVIILVFTGRLYMKLD